MLLAGLLLSTATAAAAGARPAGPQTAGADSGLPTAAPSAASQAAALAQMTGLSPQQVSTRRACPAPAPGEAACDAQVAVLRSTGAFVHPRLHRQQALASVRLGRRGRQPRAPTQPPSAAAAVTVGTVAPSGQPAPAAGTPAWLQQAYDLSYLSALGGVGDTIAVIDAFDDPNAESDLGTFRTAYGLPPCTTANGCFKKVNQGGASSPLPPFDANWAQEESLDLDAISSLCPNCNIILVEAASATRRDLLQAMAAGVTLGASQLSNSWSLDYSSPPSGRFTWSNVATIAATGDNGYMGISGDAYPAAFPGVTAVGGTTLAAGTGVRGFAESAWSSSGSGCDTAESKPGYQLATGCAGRAYSDISADADPRTGLNIYDSYDGGWLLMGGTSLATPLVAAYDAVTGVNGTTPQWAYTDSALLNDPASGPANGLCAASIFYICNAGAGYDGPTGAGSISGQVTSGGPGIGGPTMSSDTSYVQTVDDVSATMAGGVYPNGIDTTYWWEYGPTSTYGEQTPATDVGSGTTPVAVSATLSGLSPATTYHYRLVASNSAGTTYGYDYTLTTSADLTADQTQSGGTTTTTQSQSATPQSTSSSSSSSTTTATTPTTPVSTTSTIPVSTAPTTPATTLTSVSAPVSTPHAGSFPLAPPPAPAVTALPTLAGSARVGARLRVTGGTYRNGTVTAVQFERCAHTCVAVATGRSAVLTLTGADAGYYMRARVTVAGPGGSVWAWANGIVGPVLSRTAGAAVLRPGAATVRGSAGRPLAHVSTTRPRAAVKAHRSSAGAAQLVRVRSVQGAVRVWVCLQDRGAPPSCTTPVTVRHTANLTVAPRSGERVQLVAVAVS
jgi:hypothetical protein